MRGILRKGLMLVGLVGLLTQPATALIVTEGTGDLGPQVVVNAGVFDVDLLLNTPSDVLPAFLEFRWGLWNSPDVDFSVYVNSTLVGSYSATTATSTYFTHGPLIANIDITGLLDDGINTVSFDGFGASSGDYAIGYVDITYDNSGSAPIPEPASMALLGLGLAALGVRQKLRRA